MLMYLLVLGVRSGILLLLKLFYMQRVENSQIYMGVTLSIMQTFKGETGNIILQGPNNKQCVNVKPIFQLKFSLNLHPYQSILVYTLSYNKNI